jgi:hypothetical protein
MKNKKKNLNDKFKERNCLLIKRKKKKEIENKKRIKKEKTTPPRGAKSIGRATSLPMRATCLLFFFFHFHF